MSKSSRKPNRSDSSRRSRQGARRRDRNTSNTSNASGKRRPAPFFFAADVAEDLAQVQQSSEKEHNALFLVAIDIGQHLADCGHPGRWDRFSAVDFYPRLSFVGPVKLEGIGLRAMSMFHHLADIGALSKRCVGRISQDLCDFGPKSKVMECLHASFVAQRRARRPCP